MYLNTSPCNSTVHYTVSGSTLFFFFCLFLSLLNKCDFELLACSKMVRCFRQWATLILYHPGHLPAVPGCHGENVTLEIDLEEDEVVSLSTQASFTAFNTGFIPCVNLPRVVSSSLFFCLPHWVWWVNLAAEYKMFCSTVFQSEEFWFFIGVILLCFRFLWCQTSSLFSLTSCRPRHHQGPVSEGTLSSSQGVCQPWLPDSHLHQSQAASSQVRNTFWT